MSACLPQGHITEYKYMPFKKRHPAHQKFSKLQTSAKSLPHRDFIIRLNAPNQMDESSLISGATEFARLANMSPQERLAFYGNELHGVHYNVDLADIWNKHNSEPIESNQTTLICPPCWDYIIKNCQLALVYRGNSPAQAMDAILQGPTVIDCGMFCQLGIWFGIRNTLGDQKFNALFGKTPFYITQLIYNRVLQSSEPYNGCPLFSFFDAEPNRDDNKDIQKHGLSFRHISNHPSYQLKHPGGLARGHNCFVVAEQYTLFDPSAEVSSGLSKRAIEEALRAAFNKPQDRADELKMAQYTKNPQSEHPSFGISYADLLKEAEGLSATELTPEQWADSSAGDINANLYFNFSKFKQWVDQMEAAANCKSTYQPLPDAALNVPKTLLDQIPYENRDKMSFESFISSTPLQKKLVDLAKAFCQKIMQGESCMITLTGQAGIGKTASAVACAKELASRGKHIIWISEVMVSGWVTQAKTMEELEACRTEITLLLETNPDAVFLDDNNLIGFSGRVLLEVIYSWYVENPGKGLYLSSNERITFNRCYGLTSNAEYHCPPFPGYDNPCYQNSTVLENLAGKGFRLEAPPETFSVSDQEKLKRIAKVNVKDPSAAIIVSIDAVMGNLNADLEFVPSFPRDVFTPMVRSLMASDTLGPTYNKLSEAQKKYTKRFPVFKHFRNKDGMTTIKNGYHYTGIYVRIFDKTDHTAIAIELTQDTHWSGKEIINENCIKQLLSVVNFAHDQGGRQVLILNNTTFSHKEIYEKIKLQLPEREKQRTISRLEQLLGRTWSSDNDASEEHKTSQRDRSSFWDTGQSNNYKSTPGTATAPVRQSPTCSRCIIS